MFLAPAPGVQGRLFEMPRNQDFPAPPRSAPAGTREAAAGMAHHGVGQPDAQQGEAMAIVVLEIRTGRVRTHPGAGGTAYTSAIAKEPAARPLRLTPLGLEGD